MGGKIKKVGLCILLVLGSACAQAEMRMWIDANGKPFKAEFVQELYETVFLKMPDGTQRMIDDDKLSPKDLTYIRTRVPPEITISFLKQTVRKERSIYARPDDKIDIVTGVFTVQKERYPPYLGTLTATVYLIGREIATPDVYDLLNKGHESFTLTRKDDEQHEVKVSAEVRRYREYNDQTRGCEFFGYVIIVEDQSNKIVLKQSNINWMTDDNIESLCELHNHAFFDKDCQQVPVPRPEYYNTRHLFARSKLKSVK